MGKSDDSIARRKNRKTNSKAEQKVSNRVAAMIAAKKRRKSGKRRNCEGMCFSLPTPENPFNDKIQKPDNENKKKKPERSNVDKMRKDKKLLSVIKDSLNSNPANVNVHKRVLGKHKFESEPITEVVNKIQKNIANLPKEVNQCLGEVAVDTPSKFLFLCLNSIQKGMTDENSTNSKQDHPLFAHKWGVEFWKLYSSGKDVLETSRSGFNSEKVAWVASCAADTISRKEHEGLSLGSPFLLFLFPSQEKTAEARQICKPLKTCGVHSVSLHSGASIYHQIRGLKSCEPEFLLSTPARLVELISLKAVDISGVSLLVIDGPETQPEYGFADNIKLIRQSISGNPQTVIFNGCTNHLTFPDIEGLLQEPVHILSTDDKR